MEDTKKPKVLIITGTAELAATDYYDALSERGFEVDFLTMYKVPERPEFLSLMPLDRKHYFKYKIEKWINRRARKRIEGCIAQQVPGHALFYKKETEPVFPSWFITRKIRKKYDIVYVVYWWPMLTFENIKAIYRKTGAQIHFRCVDNSPVAGGCHFIGDCSRMEKGCGDCPVFAHHPESDFTSYNMDYRREVYATIKPIVYGNTHMLSIYHRSPLLKDYDRVELEKGMVLVNDKVFLPCEKQPIRKKYGIPENKKYVIAFGSQILTEKRKGMAYLLDALKLFKHRLSEEKQREVFLLIIGTDVTPIEKEFPFDYKFLGLIPIKELPDFYNAADVYLSPSIDDAGPSMVNQSLSCSTPVVAFEIGTAIDMVKGQKTGYCAKVKDAADFAEGIWKLYSQNREERNQTREACRNMALSMTSEGAFVDNLLRIYEKYK